MQFQSSSLCTTHAVTLHNSAVPHAHPIRLRRSFLPGIFIYRMYGRFCTINIAIFSGIHCGVTVHIPPASLIHYKRRREYNIVSRRSIVASNPKITSFIVISILCFLSLYRLYRHKSGEYTTKDAEYKRKTKERAFLPSPMRYIPMLISKRHTVDTIIVHKLSYLLCIARFIEADKQLCEVSYQRFRHRYNAVTIRYHNLIRR